jgi:hypothetical protein
MSYFKTNNRVSLYKNVYSDTACPLITNRGNSIDFTRLVINQLMVANSRSTGAIIFDLYLEQRVLSDPTHMQGQHHQTSEMDGTVTKLYILRNYGLLSGETLFLSGEEIQYDTDEWDLMFKLSDSAHEASIKITTRRKTNDEKYIKEHIKEKITNIVQSQNY